MVCTSSILILLILFCRFSLLKGDVAARPSNSLVAVVPPSAPRVNRRTMEERDTPCWHSVARRFGSFVTDCKTESHSLKSFLALEITKCHFGERPWGNCDISSVESVVEDIIRIKSQQGRLALPGAENGGGPQATEGDTLKHHETQDLDVLTSRLEREVEECKSGLRGEGFVSYMENFNHADNLCFFVQSSRWNDQTRHTMQLLTETSADVIDQLAEANEKQARLAQQQELMREQQESILKKSQLLHISLSDGQQKISHFLENVKEDIREQADTTLHFIHHLSELFHKVLEFQQGVSAYLTQWNTIMVYLCLLTSTYIMTANETTKRARVSLYFLWSVMGVGETLLSRWSLNVLGPLLFNKYFDKYPWLLHFIPTRMDFGSSSSLMAWRLTFVALGVVRYFYVYWTYEEPFKAYLRALEMALQDTKVAFRQSIRAELSTQLGKLERARSTSRGRNGDVLYDCEELHSVAGEEETCEGDEDNHVVDTAGHEQVLALTCGCGGEWRGSTTPSGMISCSLETVPPTDDESTGVPPSTTYQSYNHSSKGKCGNVADGAGWERTMHEYEGAPLRRARSAYRLSSLGPHSEKDDWNRGAGSQPLRRSSVYEDCLLHEESQWRPRSLSHHPLRRRPGGAKAGRYSSARMSTQDAFHSVERKRESLMSSNDHWEDSAGVRNGWSAENRKYQNDPQNCEVTYDSDETEEDPTLFSKASSNFRRLDPCDYGEVEETVAEERGLSVDFEAIEARRQEVPISGVRASRKQQRLTGRGQRSKSQRVAHVYGEHQEVGQRVLQREWQDPQRGLSKAQSPDSRSSSSSCSVASPATSGILPLISKTLRRISSAMRGGGGEETIKASNEDISDDLDDEDRSRARPVGRTSTQRPLVKLIRRPRKPEAQNRERSSISYRRDSLSVPPLLQDQKESGTSYSRSLEDAVLQSIPRSRAPTSNEYPRVKEELDRFIEGTSFGRPVLQQQQRRVAEREKRPTASRVVTRSVPPPLREVMVPLSMMSLEVDGSSREEEEEDQTPELGSANGSGNRNTRGIARARCEAGAVAATCEPKSATEKTPGARRRRKSESTEGVHSADARATRSTALRSKTTKPVSHTDSGRDLQSSGRGDRSVRKKGQRSTLRKADTFAAVAETPHPPRSGRSTRRNARNRDTRVKNSKSDDQQTPPRQQGDPPLPTRRRRRIK